MGRTTKGASRIGLEGYFTPTFAERFGGPRRSRPRFGQISLVEGPWVREAGARSERRAIVAEFRVPVPALLKLLPQAVGLGQHILRISKLPLPLVAQPAKVRLIRSPWDMVRSGHDVWQSAA
jgi:hypothetical protein